jgi:1,4-dihydroxy-2-naphthoate octaprenyltransferase
MAALRHWVAAARPATLTASVVPVAVGTAVALGDAPFKALAFGAALLGALAIQIGTNLANDYFDWRAGADRAGRIGPQRVTQAGLIPPHQVLTGAWTAFGFAVGCGTILIAMAGWPIAVLGVAAIAAGILYTGGPFPYGYVGLGDLFCFLFFGLAAVCGAYFVQTGTLSAAAVTASIPVGFTVTAILVVNNIRDIDTDRVAGKRTLAVILGRRASRAQYAILLIGAFLLPPLLWALDLAPAAALLACIAAPFSIPLIRAVFTRVDGPTLNTALRGTARLHLIFGMLFALGVLLGAGP